MSASDQQKQGTLYVITCAAQSSEPMHIQDFVRLAQSALWDAHVIATPQATKFVDIPLLEQLTGHPVRSEYKRPEEADVLPRADAIVVFPATVNTLYRWVLGIMDTLALGLLCEYMGLRMPVLAIPCVLTGSGLDSHPAFSGSIECLRGRGVRVIYEPEKYPPKNEVPWEIILGELHDMMRKYALEQKPDPNRPSGI